MIYDLTCKLKNRASKLTIKKLFLQQLSANKTDNSFFYTLPYDIQKVFFNFGYLPENHIQANNFLNSISNINEKEQYDISYAFDDIPKEKHFNLDITTYKLALYPKIWQNLTLEDRLVCLNFAYRDLIKYKLKKQS